MFPFYYQFWFELTGRSICESSKTSSRFALEDLSTSSLIHDVAETKLMNGSWRKSVAKCDESHDIRAECFFSGSKWFSISGRVLFKAFKSSCLWNKKVFFTNFSDQYLKLGPAFNKVFKFKKCKISNGPLSPNFWKSSDCQTVHYVQSFLENQRRNQSQCAFINGYFPHVLRVVNIQLEIAENFNFF